MAYNDFGPGQNISFFLITTGLDIDPLNGTVAKTNYEYLKTVISENSEILVEESALRKIQNADLSLYLNAYDQTPRNLYQALFGLAGHSSSWSAEKLELAISQAAIFPKLKPETGDYSLNPYEFYDKNFGLYRCVENSPGNLRWASVGEFKIAETMPGRNDGSDKSLWGVLAENRLNLYIKHAFSWILLEDYIEAQNSYLTVSSDTPSLVKGTYWFHMGDVNVYEYNGTIWDSGQIAKFQTTLTGGTNNSDAILVYSKSRIMLYYYFSSKYISQHISQFIIRDKLLNSIFNNGALSNFIVEDGNMALLGGSVSNLSDGDSSMIKVYGNGAFIGQFDGLDFYGSNISVSSSIDNVVEITNISNPDAGGTYGPAAFNYLQTVPTTLVDVAAGNRVVVITVEIVEPFTDATANLTIGDSSNPSRLMGEDSSDLASLVGTVFQVTPTYVYDTDQSIILTLDPGNSTGGQIKITLSYL